MSQSRPRAALDRPTPRGSAPSAQVDSANLARARKSSAPTSAQPLPRVSIDWVYRLVLQHRERRALFSGGASRRTRAERIIVSIQDLHFEIDEHGLRNWVLNASPKEAEAALDALVRIGANELARVIRRALTLRARAEHCDATEEEEYASLMQRAKLARRFAALRKEYRVALKPTYALIFAFIRDTVATSPGELPGLTVSRRHAQRETARTT